MGYRLSFPNLWNSAACWIALSTTVVMLCPRYRAMKSTRNRVVGSILIERTSLFAPLFVSFTISYPVAVTLVWTLPYNAGLSKQKFYAIHAWAKSTQSRRWYTMKAMRKDRVLSLGICGEIVLRSTAYASFTRQPNEPIIDGVLATQESPNLRQGESICSSTAA